MAKEQWKVVMDKFSSNEVGPLIFILVNSHK